MWSGDLDIFYCSISPCVASLMPIEPSGYVHEQRSHSRTATRDQVHADSVGVEHQAELIML
jgi:hypothetical protein